LSTSEFDSFFFFPFLFIFAFQSSSAESLGAASIRSENSEAASFVGKIDETEEAGLSFSAHASSLQALSEENRKLKSDVEDLSGQLETLKG
jgi:hypothetical protein